MFLKYKKTSLRRKNSKYAMPMVCVSLKLKKTNRLPGNY